MSRTTATVHIKHDTEDPRFSKIIFNGEDISDFCYGVAFTHSAGDAPQVTLQLAMCDVIIDADVAVRLVTMMEHEGLLKLNVEDEVGV